MSSDSRSAQADNEYSPISVIIVTFNEEKNIRDCLDSLARLDYPAEKVEIIVVDASSDATSEIAASYERVRLVRSEQGFSQQKNAGVQSARFEILAFTDADCIVPDNWLKVIDQAFKNPEVAAIGGNAYPPPDTSRFGKWTACVGHPGGGAIGFDANVTRTEDGIEFVAGCNSACRKKALRDAGGFDPEFYDGGEDVELSQRLKQKGHFIDYIPEMTVYHKPRKTLPTYLKWNINVGVTKFNLKRPTLGKIIFQPFFPLWSILIFMGILFLPKFPLLTLASLLILWALFIIFLALMTKPYPLLIKRRKWIGVSLLTILTVIPFLIYLRQVCISIGEMKKWWKKKA